MAMIWTTQAGTFIPAPIAGTYGVSLYARAPYGSTPATDWVTPASDSAVWTVGVEPLGDLSLYAKSLYAVQSYGSIPRAIWRTPVPY